MFRSAEVLCPFRPSSPLTVSEVRSQPYQMLTYATFGNNRFFGFFLTLLPHRGFVASLLRRFMQSIKIPMEFLSSATVYFSITIIIVFKQELSTITNIWQTVGHIWTLSLTLPFSLKQPLRGNVPLLDEVSRQSHRESNRSWPLRKVQIASSCRPGLCLQSG